LFVDTSAWVALIVEGDEFHEAAKKFLQTLDPKNPVFTSDYVFDETITRVRRIAGHRVAVRAGELLRTSAVAQMVSVTSDDADRASQIFRKHEDKELSFTDCASVAVMERLKLRSVFAFDDDFRRLGRLMKPGKS
jgi:hypothetical protein